MALDLDGLRAHVGPGPSDEVLTDLLAAALEAIDERYGPDDATVTEYLRPFGQWVRLGRRASDITSVEEGGDAVAEADYELRPGGRYVRRLADGEASTWSGMVDIVYTPYSESAERDRVTVALVDLDLNRHPGLTGITVGPWSEQYTQDDDSYRRAREGILASLRPLRVGTW